MSIENATGSFNRLDYINMIKNCVDKIVSSTNERSAVPNMPTKGILFYSENEKILYGNTTENVVGRIYHPYKVPGEAIETFNKYIFYDLETTGFWKEESPPDIIDFAFINIVSGDFIQSLVNPTIPICS